MKVLFTHSYFLHFDVKQLRQSKPYPPLATLLAASCAREAGFDVYFFDVSFSPDLVPFRTLFEKVNPDVLVIYDDGFNYLTKMCLTNMREAAFDMLSFAKKNGCKSIVSSSDSTDHFSDYLEHGASVVLLGEAEDSLLEVLRALKSNNDFFSVPGIASIKEGNPINNGRRPVRRNLDELPFAAWDLLDIKPYKSAWRKHGYFSLNMATTRGCPFKCNWCAKPIYGNRYNSRSASHVTRELVLMHSLFAFDHIWFCDDIFGLKPNWIREFEFELRKHGLMLRYKIQSRADLLLEAGTVQALSDSGCEEVWMGAESGSQKILDAMDKGTTVEQIHEANRLLRHARIKPCFFLQFGYPGETAHDLDLTKDLLFSCMPHDIGVSVSYPLPGTVFYERVKNDLTHKANWTDSDDLAMMYQATFSPRFYKALHRYIHQRFRAKASWMGLKDWFRNGDNPGFNLGFTVYFPFSVFYFLRMKFFQND